MSSRHLPGIARFLLRKKTGTESFSIGGTQ
jgi:hypothetical protein